MVARTSSFERSDGPAHYFAHADFGPMHLRVQSWFPFQVTVCLNGRLWLARPLDRAGLGYVPRDNRFLAFDDPARAQKLAAAQARAPLVRELGAAVSLEAMEAVPTVAHAAATGSRSGDGASGVAQPERLLADEHEPRKGCAHAVSWDGGQRLGEPMQVGQPA